jgi:hypothetical protein
MFINHFIFIKISLPFLHFFRSGKKIWNIHSYWKQLYLWLIYLIYNYKTKTHNVCTDLQCMYWLI